MSIYLPPSVVSLDYCNVLSAAYLAYLVKFLQILINTRVVSGRSCFSHINGCIVEGECSDRLSSNNTTTNNFVLCAVETLVVIIWKGLICLSDLENHPSLTLAIDVPRESSFVSAQFRSISEI